MELRGLFEEAVQAYGGLPVDTEFRDKNTTIKRRTVNGNEQYILERKDEGVTPDKLIRVFRDIRGFERYNERCSGYDVISEEAGYEGSVIQTYASLGKPTGIIAGRIFLDTKYIWEKDGVIVMSSVGNEVVREDYKKAHPKEAASWVDAINYMSGMYFSPIYDSLYPT